MKLWQDCSLKQNFVYLNSGILNFECFADFCCREGFSCELGKISLRVKAPNYFCRALLHRSLWVSSGSSYKLTTLMFPNYKNQITTGKAVVSILFREIGIFLCEKYPISVTDSNVT